MDQSAHQAIWCVQAPMEAYLAEKEIMENGPYIGMHNSQKHSIEWMQKLRQAGFTPPFPGGGMRFNAFVNTPNLVMADYYRPDFYIKYLDFTSPKLFALLDQPVGSLQALPTDTEWKGGDPPDWSYLWLSYVPLVPAIDMDRSEVEIEERMQHGALVRQVASHPLGRLVLRDDLVPPCGFFKAAEYSHMLLATDAVAEAVLRAGCLGIEFVEVETVRTVYGPLRRRGLHGVELHPVGVEYRRENRQPVPDA